ncbi:MAG: CYTH and CHAD domain-containing protein [Sporomusaceae bacterium]|nr:CYTH and CHAD domain-containing protein [Sporomusaceae bacterium]
MSNDFETELKLAVLPAADACVWQAVGESGFIRELAPQSQWGLIPMEAWYYDTAELSLQKAGIAYRVRREGEDWVATVKSAGSSDGGLHQRAEWNLDSPDREPRPELFAALPIGPALLEAVGGQQLQPLFATVFERRTAEVDFAGSSVELAVDEGRIIAGDATEPICELELELKSGQPEALLRLGAAIAREIPLVPEPKSKYYRALLVAGLAERQAAPPADLPPQTELTEALPRLFAMAISDFFSAYQLFLAQPEPPRHAYKMRVKLRRLRSLLLFAKPCLSGPDYQSGKQLLAEWGRALGQLRDLDVLAVQWQEAASSPFIHLDSRPWLGEIIDRRRQAQLAALENVVGGGRLSAPLLELWAWSGSRPWQAGEYPSGIGSFARWRIGGWLAALLDAGKTADWGSDRELHLLRLRLKRIRYALAALPFYNDRRTAKLLTEIKAMQALFGVLSDRATAVRLLSSIARGATRAVYRDIGILTGWQGRGEEAARSQLQSQWKRFRQAAKRWLAE